MSRKPPKKSDMGKSWMKPRRDSRQMISPEYHLIVSEGTKTEPKYFEKIKETIDAKYRDRILHHFLLVPADSPSAVAATDLHRRTHFQYPAVDSGICHIVRIADLADRQVGCDDQGEIGFVTLVDHGIDLFLRIFRTPLNPQVINDQQGIVIEGSDVLIAFLGIHGSHLIQNFGEVGHQHRYGLLQQCICDAGSCKGFAGSDISPK
jgi:hypothetical protein